MYVTEGEGGKMALSVFMGDLNKGSSAEVDACALVCFLGCAIDFLDVRYAGMLDGGSNQISGGDVTAFS